MSTQNNNVRFENVRTIAEQARTWGSKKVYPVTSNTDGAIRTYEDGCRISRPHGHQFFKCGGARGHRESFFS
jgi:hypothetical protein